MYEALLHWTHKQGLGLICICDSALNTKFKGFFSYAWLVYNTKISLGYVCHNFCELLFFHFILLMKWGDQNWKYKFMWWHCIILLYIQHYEGCYREVNSIPFVSFLFCITVSALWLHKDGNCISLDSMDCSRIM